MKKTFKLILSYLLISFNTFVFAVENKDVDFLKIGVLAPFSGELKGLGEEILYGRYWGCLKEIPFLHFELCYYSAIEFAIKNNLKKVEAGAQGEHKISRGYEPTLTYSNHWFYHSKLSPLIKKFLTEEKKKVKDTINYLNQFLPFK